MKNFIVPVDFSADSLKGLEMALLFSEKQKVNIQMVYVQKRSDDFRPGSYEEEQRYAQNQFEAVIRKYAPRLKNDSKMRYIIKKGRIHEEVVEQAESYKESVISASTHGASGFEEFFIGSNAFKIISSTRSPVITIRKKVPAGIRKIVVPLQLHVDTRQKVPVAAEMAEIFGAEIHLVSITTSHNKKDNNRLSAYLRQSSDFLKKRKVSHVAKSLHGENLITLVSNYCSAVDGDMVVIMMPRASNLDILMGSYGQQMLYRSAVPVLSVTPKAKHVPAGFTTQGVY
ncbi:MAG TPA: universal stress protein [Bacteroidales bacterium]|nr:universal stress protein [Bacteroidales bacterium]